MPRHLRILVLWMLWPVEVITAYGGDLFCTPASGDRIVYRGAYLHVEQIGYIIKQNLQPLREFLKEDVVVVNCNPVP